MKLSLVSTMLFFVTIEMFGQSVINFEPSRTADAPVYRQHFSQYAIGSMDKAQVASLLQSKPHFDTLTLVADGVTYRFRLDARDMRGDNFKLVVDGSNGIEEQAPLGNVTFAGSTLDENLPVCITADGTFFTAMIMRHDGDLYIESAKMINPSASEDQFVIYKAKDLTKSFKNSLCGTKELPGTITEKQEVPDERSNMAPCLTIEIAIANDYSMYQKYGSNTGTVMIQNLAVINLVNTNYDLEFNYDIWFKVATIYIYTSASGSPWYTGTDYNLLLNSFTDWAPAGFGVPHDCGSLWTNRDLDGGVVGLAWVDVVCDSAYNILQDFSTHYALLRVVQAHELGHNFGYGHDEYDGVIMSPSVSNTNNWSPESINAINPNLAPGSPCLTFCQQETSGRVGIGTTSPHVSAALDITSNSKGLLIPRLTPVQRNNIYLPAEGLMVYDTGSKSYWFYNSTGWVEMIDNTAIQPMPNNNITMAMQGNIGIGVDPPFNKIDIATSTRTNLLSNVHPTNLPVYITGSAPDYNGLEIRTTDAYVGIGITPSKIYATGWATNSNIEILAKGANGFLQFTTNAIERMRITGSGNVGIGNPSPNASAILDVSSTSKGMLVPRMTTAERNAIASPANGLLVFDITTGSFWYRKTGSWLELSDNLDQELFRNGPDKIYMALTDSVGIGTNNPATKLEVKTAINQFGISHTDGVVRLASRISTSGEIGTITNHSLRLFANNGSNQFHLLPNGNVGINVATADHKLDIASGAARTGTHATSGRPLYITGTLSDSGDGVEIRHADGTQGVGIGRNTLYAAGSSTNQNLGLLAKGTTGNLLFSTNSLERARIDGDGDMGIGLTNPVNKLDIALGTRTNAHATGRPLYVTAALGDASNGAEFRDIDGTQGIGIGRNTLYAVGSWLDVNIGLASKGPAACVSFSTNATERMRILGTGQVGIGTITPHAQLQLATSVANRKLVIYEVADNDHQYHGFGINGDGSLRYQTANTSNDHVFYAAASSGASNELARFRGSNGNLAIAGVIEVETYIAPTLLNSFTNYGAGYAAAGYYKDKEGTVRLRGLVNNVGEPDGLVVFNLPAGYRPSSGQLIFYAPNNDLTCRVDVKANGDVFVSAGVIGWISLSAITFRAD